jgi:hypothetical protein
VRGVEGENLWTSKIITTLKAFREAHRQETVVVDDLICAPAVGGLVVTVIEDLKPTIAGSRVSAGISNLLQVNGTGTLVAAVKTLF